MKWRMIRLLMLLICPGANLLASDTLYIKVHFLYGSKPRKEYKDTEQKWFGGKLGGHVGIEIDSNRIIDFVPAGKFHWFGHRKEKNGAFATHTIKSFWEIFGTDSGEVKKTTVVIPITSKQKMKLDSIYDAYTSESPYDYAFVGMRCAAAAYDILSQIDVVPKHSRPGTFLRNFYPKKLRKRLLRMATQNKWSILHREGTFRRKWEKD